MKKTNWLNKQFLPTSPDTCDHPIGILPSASALSHFHKNTARLYEQETSKQRIGQYWSRWIIGLALLVPCVAFSTPCVRVRGLTAADTNSIVGFCGCDAASDPGFMTISRLNRFIDDGSVSSPRDIAQCNDIADSVCSTSMLLNNPGTHFYKNTTETAQYFSCDWTPGVGYSNGVFYTPTSLTPPSPNSLDMVNVSTRGEAGQGANQMVVGFVVKGGGRKQFMVSGVGLTTGVPGAISNPELTIFNQAAGEEVYHCDDWRNCLGSSIVQVFLDNTGQSLTNSEAAASLSFEAGAYTIEIRDADGGSGIAMGTAIEIPTNVDSDDVAPGTWKSEDGAICFNVAATGDPKLTSDSSDCPDGASLAFNLNGKTSSGEVCKVTSSTTDDVIIDYGQFYWEGSVGSEIETASGVFFETGFATGSATERNAGTSLSSACIADWSARP